MHCCCQVDYTKQTARSLNYATSIAENCIDEAIFNSITIHYKDPGSQKGQLRDRAITLSKTRKKCGMKQKDCDALDCVLYKLD
jgi:hypothetical protein